MPVCITPGGEEVKLPSTNQRPAQISVPIPEIQKRTKEFLASTRHSIVSVEDILWSFPERQAIPNYKVDKWQWSQIKRRISNYLNEQCTGEWCDISSTHQGAVRVWKRRTEPVAIQPKERIPKVKEPVMFMSRIGIPAEREPWNRRLARYRRAYEKLVVVENGGSVVKEYLTTPEEVTV
jgi:hypothetical protein